MMANGVTLLAWRQCLEARGHQIRVSGHPTVTGFNLWPSPETIVTVAADPDETTLKESYRERYFLCEPEPEQVFGVIGCPEPHRGRWLELIARQPEGYWRDFLAGPGSWTLSRLARFREVIVWADRGLPWEGLDEPVHRNWGMVVPTEAV